MAIRFTKYINITSGVGAGAVVANRELIGRLFTVNPLLPPASMIEFDTADEVGNYFGFSSEEYNRAIFYFSWISKNITKAQKISFARWVDAATAPKIYGKRLTASLANLQAITAGTFNLVVDGVSHALTGLNFVADLSLADVAASLQFAIRALVGVQFTAATVAYDATRGAFNFVGGDAVAATLAVTPGTTGTDISSLIGWLPESINGSADAIWSDGALAETITETLSTSANASDNFGSFLFMPVLTSDEVLEAATWNDGQNVKYLYTVPVPDLVTAQAYNTALINLSGVGITVSAISGEYAEQVPMMILAATNYNARNSTQNYMYQQFNLTASVTTDANSDAYDALRANYYGQTQQAGRKIAFYQRGVLMGLATAPVDMNIYANEIWLKDSVGVQIMSLLLNISKVSANDRGRGQLLSVIQNVINQALFNNVISIDGVLSNTQKLYIGEITGDDLAWHQVQGIGYWLDCQIVQVIVNDIIEYRAEYTLIYKKDDVVRSVAGRHILI